MRFLRRTTGQPRQRFQRGVYILPTLFTLGNMFCGYACIVYAMHGEFETAAPFIGYSIVLDMLDGRIARMTGSASDFGVEFDSLADVISFGIAPAILSLSWGLQPLGRLGWLAGFLFLTAAAMRLARFNIQSGMGGDKRYFVGMPTPAAAGVVAATVYAVPALPENHQAFAAMAVMLVPAALMVSVIRFRSFRTINFGWGRSYLPLFLFILLLAFIATKPKVTCLLLAYAYLLSAFIEWGITRWRTRRDGRPAASS